MQTARWSVPIVLVLIGSFAHTVYAGAVSPRVKVACRADYFRYCSAYPVGSEAVRQCMNQMGGRLSGACVQALVDAGEISPEAVNRHKDRFSNR
jgi:hypothetical protein